jgi:hypothetical protein
VVVDDLDIVRSSFGPAETDAPLVVDADAVLTDAIPSPYNERRHMTQGVIGSAT